MYQALNYFGFVKHFKILYTLYHNFWYFSMLWTLHLYISKGEQKTGTGQQIKSLHTKQKHRYKELVTPTTHFVVMLWLNLLSRKTCHMLKSCRSKYSAQTQMGPLPWLLQGNDTAWGGHETADLMSNLLLKLQTWG